MYLKIDLMITVLPFCVVFEFRKEEALRMFLKTDGDICGVYSFVFSVCRSGQ